MAQKQLGKEAKIVLNTKGINLQISFRIFQQKCVFPI